MTSSIRIHYLYRDSGNYKQFYYKDFSNTHNLSIQQVRCELEKYLIDGMYFYPEKVGIEKFDIHRFCDDYSWYEVEKIEEINENSSEDRIEDFICKLRVQNRY